MPKPVTTLIKIFQKNDEKNKALWQSKKTGPKLGDKMKAGGEIIDPDDINLSVNEEIKGEIEESKAEIDESHIDNVAELDNIDTKTNKTNKSKLTAKTKMTAKEERIETQAGEIETTYKVSKQKEEVVHNANEIDFESEIERPRRFIERSNLQSLSFNKNEKFYAIHKILSDEEHNNCGEMAILKLNRKLNKLLDKIIKEIKDSMRLENERK